MKSKLQIGVTVPVSIALTLSKTPCSQLLMIEDNALAIVAIVAIVAIIALVVFGLVCVKKK